MEVSQDVLKRRLAAKESHLTKVGKRYIQFQSQIQQLHPSSQAQVQAQVQSQELQPSAKEINHDDQVLEEKYQNLLSDLSVFEYININHPQRHVWESSDFQMQKYAEVEQQKTNELEAVTLELNQLKETLVEETRLRKNKEEYEALKKTINQLPSRADTQKEIEQLHADLQALSTDSAEISTKFELRKKQFQLLLFSIHQLSQCIEEDRLQEEAAARLKLGEGTTMEDIPPTIVQASEAPDATETVGPADDEPEERHHSRSNERSERNNNNDNSNANDEVVSVAGENSSNNGDDNALEEGAIIDSNLATSSEVIDDLNPTMLDNALPDDDIEMAQ